MWGANLRAFVLIVKSDANHYSTWLPTPRAFWGWTETAFDMLRKNIVERDLKT